MQRGRCIGRERRHREIDQDDAGGDLQTVCVCAAQIVIGPGLFEYGQIPAFRERQRCPEDLRVRLEGVEDHPDERIHRHDQQDEDQQIRQQTEKPLLDTRFFHDSLLSLDLQHFVDVQPRY